MKLCIDDVEPYNLSVFVAGREMRFSDDSSIPDSKKSILDILGRKEGTDKSSDGHNYLHFYERFLAPLRDQPVSVLEIGVGNGASIRMWRDYFIQGKIIGMDNNEHAKHYSGERIIIEIGDQNDGDALHRIASSHGPFHVVVDDAGHEANAQMFSYNTLKPYMRDKSIYILEDIMDDRVMDFFADITKKIIKTHDHPYESISFYKETAVTRYK